jgi:Cu(I)/Ag(I) efflux system membrane fusion protein
MKKSILTASLVVAMVIGIILGRWWLPGRTGVDTDAADGEREVLYWQAPMDPGFRSDRPGKSPMGMDLIPVYADGAGEADPSVVTISPKIVNSLGVRTAPVEQGVLSRRVETVGYVGYDEDTLHHIHSRVDGWVEMLAVTATGDPVENGQVLFELYSPTLVNAQEEYLTALTSGNTVLLRASRDRLAALGVTLREINRLDRERKVKQRVQIYAESDGFVAHLGIREGMYITPGTEVMSIAQLDRVWVLAEVFERQAAWVRPGQIAEVVLDFLPGRRWQSSVDYVYPEIDPDTRTLTVRMRFDNKSEILKPNMFARVTIHGTETPEVLHIPREALIRGGSVDRVVLALGAGKFRAQPVTTGVEAGDRIEVRGGLATGDVVVTSGQFLIDSESNIESALARLNEGSSEQVPVQIQVSATVVGTDAAQGRITLQHDPVPEWSWSAMTMEFGVSDRTLLSAVNEGQSVEVSIRKQPDGQYLVTGVAPPINHDEHSSRSDR